MKILVTIIVVIAAFEVIEHVIVPLVWLVFVRRKKPSVSGATGLVGRMVEVKTWQGAEGYVLVKGELWKAVCDDPLSVGQKAVVHSVDGLTLRVARAGKLESTAGK